LAEILSTDAFTIESAGELDPYGRVLARFMVFGVSVEDILVSEGLARPWAGRREDWCE
jgi:endonuclease YncB( thermonuclease family)